MNPGRDTWVQEAMLGRETSKTFCSFKLSVNYKFQKHIS